MTATPLRAYHPSEPLPLVPERSRPLEYPLDALGPILAGAARAIVEATHCAAPTAAQSTLAVAALATQAHADVVTPAGQKRPLSLFLVTIAASGERKSAADGFALKPVRDAQDQDRDPYRLAHQGWRNRNDAWEAERTKIKRGTKTDAEAKREALDFLGPEPLPPLRPERTAEDVTCEGLIKSWADCHGARGLFTAEGAKVMAGHAMSDEARMRTAATYSGLWDDGRAERIRAGDGFLSLRGRRLSAHLMAQPGVAAAFLQAGDLVDQGFIGRFLVCEAPELAGTRLFREPPSDGDHRLVAYDAAVRRLIRRPPSTFDGRNELDPRPLRFSAEAKAIWLRLHDAVETKLGSSGELGGVKSFGGKLAEQAARIGGVLTVLEDPDAGEIDADTMNHVVDLADYYASEAERLNATARTAPALALAERLRAWLIEAWPERLVSRPDILQRGPYAVRTKEVGERCIALLQDHGWLVPIGPARVGAAMRQATYAIAGRASP